MIRSVAITLALLAALPLGAATLSGTVRDAASGAGLSAMTVEAYTSDGIFVSRTTTGAGGGYTLTIAAGSYRFLAYDNAGNYATSFYVDADSFATSDVITIASGASFNATFSLRRAASIAGVVRSDSGSPLAGMTVAVYNASGTERGRTTTDASGAYRLIVPAGSYRIGAWDNSLNYLPRFNSDARFYANAPLITVATSTEARADVTLPSASSFRGFVRDDLGRVLSGMVVEAWDASGVLAARALTDGSGAYRLAVEAGAYRLVFYDPAGIYAPAYYGNARSFSLSELLSVGSGAARLNVNGVLVRAARVSGRVTDARTGAALAQIAVGAWNEDGTLRAFTRTDGAGDYVLVLPPGSYRIGAYDEALVYATRFRGDTASFAGSLPLAVFAGDAYSVNFSLSRGGRFSGRTLSSGGVPVGGLTVAAYDSSGTLVAETRSGAEGSYAIVVAPGSYRLAAWDDTRQSAAVHVDAAVAEGEVKSVDLVLVASPPRRRSVHH